VVSVKLQQ